MMMRLLLAAMTFLGLLAPAHADPIFTPMFAAALVAASLPTTVAGVSVAAVLASVTTTALGIGLSLLLSRSPKQSAESGLVPIKQPVPYAPFAYGTVRLSGVVVLWEATGNYLHYVIAFVRHRAAEFVQLYLHDDAVTLNPANNMAFLVAPLTGPMHGTVNPLPDGRYANESVQPVVWIDTRIGLVPETPYAMIRNLLGANWTAKHRGDGCASLAMICSPTGQQGFTKAYPNQSPQPSMVGNWKLLFDPRDEAQDPNNEATWQFSRNPVLFVLDFLCFSPAGYRNNYTTTVLPILSRWTQAMDDCDTSVSRKGGGTEPRYRGSGWGTEEQDRRIALQSMLAAFDGWLCRRGDGTVDIEIGVYYAPVVLISDADILGVKLQTGASSETRINQATARWTSPDHNYVSVETDPVLDTADQALRPGAPVNGNIDLGWVQSVGQASRLLRREMFRQRQEVRGTLTLRWSGLNACYARRVRIQSNKSYRMADLVVEVRAARLSPMSQTCEIDFLQTSSVIDSEYVPGTMESDVPPVPVRPSSGGLSAPADVNATAEQITDPSGSAVVILNVSWDAPTNTAIDGSSIYFSYVVHWRVKGPPAGTWQETTYPGLVPSAGRLSIETGVVPSGTLLEVQVATYGITSRSPFSTPPLEVNTEIASVAPGSPIWIAATGGAGFADLSCTNPNSGNFSAVQFYRAATGDPFIDAVPVGPKIFGAPNATSAYTDTVAAGTYDYFAVALNAADVGSTPAGPQTATVT